MDSKIDHHPLSVASQFPATQIVLDASDQRPGIVVLVIDDEASGGIIEEHS